MRTCSPDRPRRRSRLAATGRHKRSRSDPESIQRWEPGQGSKEAPPGWPDPVLPPAARNRRGALLGVPEVRCRLGDATAGLARIADRRPRFVAVVVVARPQDAEQIAKAVRTRPEVELAGKKRLPGDHGGVVARLGGPIAKGVEVAGDDGPQATGLVRKTTAIVRQGGAQGHGLLEVRELVTQVDVGQHQPGTGIFLLIYRFALSRVSAKR